MSIRLQYLREAWSFLQTFVGRAGEVVVDTTNNRVVVHDGSTPGGFPMVTASDLQTLQNVKLLGVRATADTTNRLSVKSEAALFSWDDATPGAGNMRATVNKKAAANDAGFVFQTAFSTRALLGTLGADDFALKVSPDGAAFSTPLAASAATGRLTLGRINGPLEASNNTGALPAPPSDTVLRVSGGDGAQPRLVFDSFGTNVPGNFIFRAASGTAAAAGAVQAGMSLGQFSAFGYGATGYSAGARAQIQFVATETWTDAAQGVRILFRTCATGTVAAATAVTFEANGSLGLVPSAMDPAAEAAAGQVRFNSTQTALKLHTGTAWTRISNFAKAAAYASSDTYAAAATWTKVNFNNADSNDQGAFVAASSRFVAPEAGLYNFNVALVFKKNGTNNPTAMEIQLYKNGAAAGRGRAAATGTLVDGVTALDLTSTLKLAATDYVEVYVRFTTTDGYAAAADSFFGGQQMP